MGSTPHALIVEFLDGRYIGSNGPGARVENYPDLRRLHASLLAMAGTGSLSVPEAQRTVPPSRKNGKPKVVQTARAVSPVAIEALTWLESHPPQQIALPLTHRAADTDLQHFHPYRNKGRYDAKGNRALSLTPVNNGVVVNGVLAYWWETIPDEVAATLAILAGELSYLGTAESVVRAQLVPASSLSDLDDVSPHRIVELTNDTTATKRDILFSGTRPGRTRELIDTYAAAQQSAIATPPQNKPGTTKTLADEHSMHAAGTPNHRAAHAFLRRLVYRPTNAHLRSPWDSLITIPLDTGVGPQWHTELAVRTHRTLVKLIGEGCPSVINGIYAPGEPRLANHMAIHFLDASLAPEHLRAAQPEHAAAFLILATPTEMSPAHRQLLTDALTQFTGDPHNRKATRGGLYPAHHKLIEGVPVVRPIGPAITISAENFWSGYTSAADRLTYPAAINEVTGLSEHVVHTALANVFRDRYRLGEALAHRHSDQVAQWRVFAEEQGCKVHDIEAIHTNIGAYMHKTPDLRLHPYRTRIELGSLTDTQAFLAIGQTRHLGGGMLIPIDALTLAAHRMTESTNDE